MFVILTITVSTALLSTSGHPPRGIVITFGVFAGLLVFSFLSCHLMLYCTRIKHEMDMERANGDKNDADPSSELNKNIPPGFIDNTNTDAQAQQRERDQPEQVLKRDEQQRQSQTRPNLRMSRNTPTRSSAALYESPAINQITSHGSDRPQLRAQAVSGVYQQSSPPTSDQRLREELPRHPSAFPDALNVRKHQARGVQQPSRLEMDREVPPSRHLNSRRTSGADGTILHSERTSVQTDVVGPPPQEASRRHRAAAREAAPQQMLQHGARNSPLQVSTSAAQQMEREMHFPGPQDRLSGVSARSHAERYQAEPRLPPANRPYNLQAQFALLGSQNIWGRGPRFFPDLKPGARVRRMSADDCLRRPPWGLDDVDLIVLRDVDCKVVRVHPAPPDLKRVQSQKVLVQRLRSRDSNDSGYYSAGSSQHQPWLAPGLGPPTAFSWTSISSPGSTWPPTSNESPVSSSLPSARSNQPSLHRLSASSMDLVWMSRHSRVSISHDGSARGLRGTPLRHERQRPLGRSNTL